MAVTLNANTSTGFIATSDTSGVLQLQTGGTTAVTVDASQNVGIGVTPSAWSGVKALQVGSGACLVDFGSSNTIFGSNFYNDGANKYINTDFASFYQQNNGIHAWASAASGTAGNTISFTQAMTLDASGNLLVGQQTATSTTTPVRISSGGTYGTTLLNGIKVAAYDAGGTLHGMGVISGSLYLNTTDATTVVAFGTNNTERARIDLSGRLLVGVNTAPDTAARGVFNSSSGATIVVSSSVLGNGNSAYFSARNIDTVRRDCDIGVYKHAGITNSCGYVGYVEEEGTAQYTWVGNDGNLRISTDPGAIGTNGGTVVGTQSSDERIKNIVGEVQYGLNEILALEPIAFAMKDSPDNKKLGFSAQQVQPIIPEAVYDTGDCIDGYDVDPENKMERTPKSDRTKLSMEYTQIVPVLVKAIQEQQAIIQTLTDRITALEGTTP